MIYKFTSGAVRLEFSRNRGRAYLAAAGRFAAVDMLRCAFRFTREENIVEQADGSYQIDFKVSLDYRLPLLRQIERTIKVVSSAELYAQARYVDQYIVATIARDTTLPPWMAAIDLKKEIAGLRKSAVVAREVPNLMRFVDWDICIANFIELNSKEGYRSRVVRTVTSDPDESSVSIT